MGNQTYKYFALGMMAMVGGKDKTKIRNSTPPAFRDLLISIAVKVKM